MSYASQRDIEGIRLKTTFEKEFIPKNFTILHVSFSLFVEIPLSMINIIVI